MAGRSQSTFRDKEHEPHPHSILTALFALQLRVPSQVSTRSGPEPESSAGPEANAKGTRPSRDYYLQQKNSRQITNCDWLENMVNLQHFSLVISTSIMAMNQ
jgi:hypothetical protein